MTIRFCGRTIYTNNVPGSSEQIGNAIQKKTELRANHTDAGIRSDSNRSAAVLTNKGKPHLDTSNVMLRAENTLMQSLTPLQKQLYEKLCASNHSRFGPYFMLQDLTPVERDFYYKHSNPSTNQFGPFDFANKTFTNPTMLRSKKALLKFKKQYKDGLKDLFQDLKKTIV